MSRPFHPIAAAVWSSPAFLSLTGDGRQLHLYFLCGPHQSNAGCCRIREGYGLADLGWQPEQYRRALADVVQANLVMHDPATEETYVLKWFKHKGNVPTNRDHAKGVMTNISAIDSDDIREQAEADFMETDWGKRITAAETEASAVVQPISSALANSRLIKGGRL